MRSAAVWLIPALAWAQTPYAGGQACAPCHRSEAQHQSRTAMAKALESVAACEILKTHPKLTFREGPYSSEIVREGGGSTLTVTDGAARLSVPLLYAFGLGQAGQTYVFEYGGALHESRASFYNALQGLDLTMGAQGTRPATLEEAAGRRMDASDAKACFGCHTTGPERAPGVSCEGCHGPAAGHVIAVKVGQAAAPMSKLGALATEDMSDLCGTCHRTWSQIALSGPRGVNNVRFQPYRLTNSKCYDAADARIRCTACHDPHSDPVRVASFYDAKCTACHSAAGHAKLCKAAARSECVTCHMPKIELPGAHTRFTDHQIRIARAGGPYPN